jgi:putative hydrolase of the HAD superfamily
MKLSEGLNITASEIKNIIFDWGGVITDLHVEKIVNAFKGLGFQQIEDFFLKDDNDNFFLLFELGLIDEPEFISKLRRFLKQGVSDKQIIDAWNTILGDLPSERWELLKSLKNSYRIFLLSNTNSLHVSYYNLFLEKKYGTNGYEHLFEKVYFSFKLGMRKPDLKIYEFVLLDSKINPEETLFIDDNYDNILTASQLGIKCYHLVPPFTLSDLFQKSNYSQSKF